NPVGHDGRSNPSQVVNQYWLWRGAVQPAGLSVWHRKALAVFFPAQAGRLIPSIERTCPGKPGHASHVKR
ncbi:hypothetical protein, partial [Paracidovorax sp. MALMAid1276]|uniref:hypothetical protein n=1 Tax=Paracidovorax sp. MALMAid1276 TaxID=3411631 RepID=UPI003B9B0EF5